MKIIAGSSHLKLSNNIAKILGIDLVQSIFKKFEDGELYVEIKDDLQNEDVIIVQSTSKPVNDNLIELLLLIDAARRTNCRKIILVIPYFGYSRQDRIIGSGTALSAQLIANMLECAGADKIITIDIHSKNIEQFFKIPFINLSIIDLIIPLSDMSSQPVIVSPDMGSITRAREISKVLNCDFAVIDKSRSQSGDCQMIGLQGNVKGRHCILIDDIIDTGNTICKAADFLTQHGALILLQ